MKSGFSVGSCIRKKGSLNTNFNLDANISTRCSSLLQGENEVNVRTPISVIWSRLAFINKCVAKG